MGEIKKFFIQIFFIFLVIVLALLYQYNPNFGEVLNRGLFRVGGTTQKDLQNQVRIGQTLVNIELADTNDKRAKGLGGRQSMATDSGMLFVFPKVENYKFWMKGLSFPLDFVWIREGKVVDLVTDVPAPAKGQADNTLPIIESNEKVDQVLEVNAGFVRANNVQVGDSVQVIKR